MIASSLIVYGKPNRFCLEKSMVTHFIQWHVITCSGAVSNKRSYLVGKYAVQLNSFENTALPTLRIPKNTQVFIRHTCTCILLITIFIVFS